MSDQPNQATLEDVENRSQHNEQAPGAEVSGRPVDTRSETELTSTSDTESCWTYFTRKMESLGAEDPVTAITEEQFSERDEASISDSVPVTRGVNFFELAESPNENPPEVTFLESSTVVRGSTESGPGQMPGEMTGNPGYNLETRSDDRRERGSEQSTTEESNIGAERKDYRCNTSILRIVADESAPSSFGMFNSKVQRASQLSLYDRSRTPPRGRAQRSLAADANTGVDVNSSLNSDVQGESTSQGFTSDPDSHHDFQSSVNLASPPTAIAIGSRDSGTTASTFECFSPGAQTLANFQQEALRQKRKASKKPSGAHKTSRHPKPCKPIGRVMRQEYFESMPWTLTFVSGSMGPKWNKHKIYCQIYKCNVSIRAKGPKEILRHYATESHLRKDQRWRYEYLTTGDPVTKRTRYHKRGRDGKVLTNYQVQLELPHFIKSELLDIGENLPFYEEAMTGEDHMAASPQKMARLRKHSSWDTTSPCLETLLSFALSGSILELS